MQSHLELVLEKYSQIYQKLLMMMEPIFIFARKLHVE